MKTLKTPVSDLEIEESSGNVFEDLGFSHPEEHRVKANLAIQINRIIKERGLNQTKAAALLRIDQPKISALNRGRLSGFSVERLFKFLSLLDQDIKIEISPHRGLEKQTVPHIDVVYAESR